METKCRCHSCGNEVKSNLRRCPNCYVSLAAASRAPSPLRAAPSARAVNGQVALASPVAEVEEDPGEDLLVSGAVTCPVCETTVIPVRGRCSYCCEPLSDPVAWGLPEELDSDVSDLGPRLNHAGGQIIIGPWAPLPVAVHYAPWSRRAGAALLDLAVFLPVVIASTRDAAAGLVMLVAGLLFSGWQLCWRQGRTGHTFGKRCLGIALLDDATLTPIGPRRAALRQLGHVIDAALLGLGYLWPLWDAKRQTFADQLASTVVVPD